MDWPSLVAAIQDVLTATRDALAGIWDWETIFNSIPALLRGLVRTFELVGISLVLGFMLAVPLALKTTIRTAVSKSSKAP